MKCLTIFVGLVAILVGIIVYKVYLPLSPKLSEDTLVLPALFNLGDLFAYVGGKLGIAPRYWIMRFIIRSIDGSEKGHFDGEGDVEDTTVSGVPVRIYRPRTGLTHPNNARPCFIYFHGGGLTLFSARSKIFDKMLSKFSAATGSVVISVDYRLAPEHMFPAQFQDCYSVVSTVIAESTKFGIIKNKIVIGGDSAGGLLSAAISLEFAKEKRAKDIAAQILINPWLQSIDMTCLPSHRDYAQGFMITREQTAYYAAIVTTGKPDMQQEYLSGNVSRYFRQTPYWKLLEIPESSNCAQIPSEKNFPEFPPQFVQTTVDQHLSPLLADTVEGVPPTFVAISQYDILASEGSLFARRLEKAGISVVHKIYKTYHGFIANLLYSYTTTPMVTEAMQDIINYLNSVFYEH